MEISRQLNFGRLEWIGLRPAHKQPMIEADQVYAIAGLGLEGDHRCEKTPGSARQVTLISHEYIQQLAEKINQEKINPALLRRNLVISGFDMDLLRFQQLKIGDAIFETSALCHPCSRMDQALGEGTKESMMGLGGLCAKILQTGIIRVGDKVELLEFKTS
jgi:MOSC domain-containing protein YiiM